MALVQRKNSRSLLLVAGLGVFLASCSEGKVAQCQRLIEAVNEIATKVETVTSAPDAVDNPESLNQIAGIAEEASTTIAALEFEDEQLLDSQSGFVTMYQETATSSRLLYEAVQAGNLEAVQQAESEFQSAVAQEDSLVNTVNAYCVGEG